MTGEQNTLNNLSNLKDALRALDNLIRRIHIDTSLKKDTKNKIGKALDIRGDLVYFADAQFGGLMLTGEDAKEYRKIVEAIYSRAVGKAEYLSRSAVESIVRKCILKALDGNQSSQEDFQKRLKSALGNLQTELKAAPTIWEVHYSVDGILRSQLPRTFGNCEFYFGDATYLDALLQRIDKTICSLVDSSNLERARAEASHDTRKLVENKTGVRVKVEAVDAEAAKLLGKKIARQTVDILNFYANLGQGPPSEVLLFAEGRGPGVLYTFLFAENPPAFQTPMERFGPVIPFSFAAAHLEKTGFERMSRILKKIESERTFIEDNLVSAFQWAGRASVDPRKEEAFLLFAISLESLLMGLERDDRSEITEKLALRGAHLIARGLESRLTVYKDLKKLYGIRSKVVHSGSVDVGDDQLTEIRYYARLALLTMLCSSELLALTTDDELRNWFRTKLLGVGQETVPATSATTTSMPSSSP